MSGGRVRIEGVVKRHGATTVLHDASLQIEAGEFFVLLGPSGSGKTTTLRVLAGLETIQAGRVWMDERDVTLDEPGDRDVAMVFQSYALYPHMTVEQNIGFPLRMIGRPPEATRAAVAEAAAKVHIGHLLARRPGELSGGQQQRCALARAIVRQPRLFLLDEPLSNLDAKLRVETRLELRKLQRALGVTMVYVTHDQEEAMTLADRMAVFMDGRIVQVGTPKAIYSEPATAAVAAFIGTPPMNLLPAMWTDSAVHVGRAAADATAAAGAKLAVGLRTVSPREVTLGIRPSDWRLSDDGLPARIELIEDLGDTLILDLHCAGQQVKLKTTSAAGLAEGAEVRLTFDAGSAHLFDRASGQRITQDSA